MAVPMATADNGNAGGYGGFGGYGSAGGFGGYGETSSAGQNDEYTMHLNAAMTTYGQASIMKH